MTTLLTIPSLALMSLIAHAVAIPENHLSRSGNRTSALAKRVNGYGFGPGTISWNSAQSSGDTTPFLSTDGGTEYHFGADGNIVVTQNGNVKWGAYPSGTRDCSGGKCSLVFQGDGNLVAYDNAEGVAFWSTGTNSYPGHSIAAAALFLGDSYPWIQLYSEDYYCLWLTAENGDGGQSHNPDAQVETGAGFNPGVTFMSKNAQFLELHNDVLFNLGTDGNIVVHNPGNGQVYWASGTTGHNCGTGYCYLQFSNNGNLAAYDASSGSPVKYWNTDTANKPGYHGPADALFFSNTAPYIFLYDAQGNMLWETSGTSGYTQYAPDYEPGEPGYKGTSGGPGLCPEGTTCNKCYEGCAPSPPTDPQESPEPYPDPPTGTLLQQSS